MRFVLVFLSAVLSLLAQPGADRLLSAIEDRTLADQAMRLKTDERISLYATLVQHQPEQPHYRNLLATAYVQKMRETTDFGYIDRASKILEEVLSEDKGNYEALRMRSAIELERHNFAKVAQYSRQLISMAPDDPWNYGTLGDALIELGDYEPAGDAYQKMVSLRPDLSSYNRASHYRFLHGDLEGAIQIMEKAIESGSPSAENVAWCWVELGNLLHKARRLTGAERAYRAAIQTFGNYHPAFAGLGRLQQEQGKRAEAIENFRRAQSITPLVDYAAALYDLYREAGNAKEAEAQLALIDMVDRLGEAAKEKVNRSLALVLAGQNRKLDRALELAQAEFAVRKDVYSYDTLAWVLFRRGRYLEAQEAIRQALRLNTPEPSFRRHAELIAKAVGQ